MIPRGYPQVPVRTKLGLTPVLAAIFALYVLGQAGVIDLRLDADGPGRLANRTVRRQRRGGRNR